MSNLNQIITTVTKHGYAIAQEYVPEIEKGEKRLLLLGAEPIRVGKRVAIYRRHSVIGNPESATSETAATRSRGVKMNASSGDSRKWIKLFASIPRPPTVKATPRIIP